MKAADPSDRQLPSLLAVTVRRAAVSGRLYLVSGIGLSLFYGVILGVVSGPTFASVFPVLLPVVSTTGGMGAMMVFTNDRVKGVLEYLLAYGFSPLRLFANILAAALLLETLVLGVTISAGVGVDRLAGHPLSPSLAQAIAEYTIPMGLASVALATTIGMVWTALSSPREGLSSPIGLVPLLGVGPALVTLIVAEVVASATRLPVHVVTSAAILLVAVAVLATLSRIERLLPRERLLSPT